MQGDETVNTILGVFCLIVLAGGFLVFVRRDRTKIRQFHAAQDAYNNALARLKQDPNNPHLREETLARGREYSNLTRNNRGVTIYDEMALMNDINAATAGAGTVQASGSAFEPRTVEDRLDRLNMLRSNGTISEHEYEAKRRQILDGL